MRIFFIVIIVDRSACILVKTIETLTSWGSLARIGYLGTTRMLRSTYERTLVTTRMMILHLQPGGESYKGKIRRHLLYSTNLTCLSASGGVPFPCGDGEYTTPVVPSPRTWRIASHRSVAAAHAFRSAPSPICRCVHPIDLQAPAQCQAECSGETAPICCTALAS
jgi:hypothetical protein